MRQKIIGALGFLIGGVVALRTLAGRFSQECSGLLAAALMIAGFSLAFPILGIYGSTQPALGAAVNCLAIVAGLVGALLALPQRGRSWGATLLALGAILFALESGAASALQRISYSSRGLVFQLRQVALGRSQPVAEQLGRGPLVPDSADTPHGMLRFSTIPTPPQGSVRVIVYGDSVVQGVGVRLPRDKFVNVLGMALQQRLGVPSVTMNGGRSGCTTHEMRRGVTLGQTLQTHRPRLVIVYSGRNDCLWSPSVTLLAAEAALSRTPGVAARLLMGLASWQLMARAAAGVLRGGRRVRMVPPADAHRNLSAIVKTAGALSIPVLLVSQPVQSFRGEEIAPGRRCRGRHRAIQKQLARSNSHVGYMGLAEWFLAHGPPSLFRDDVHPNRRGHKHLARLMLRHVLENWPGRAWLKGQGGLSELAGRPRVTPMPAPPRSRHQ